MTPSVPDFQDTPIGTLHGGPFLGGANSTRVFETHQCSWDSGNIRGPLVSTCWTLIRLTPWAIPGGHTILISSTDGTPRHREVESLAHSGTCRIGAPELSWHPPSTLSSRASQSLGKGEEGAKRASEPLIVQRIHAWLCPQVSSDPAPCPAGFQLKCHLCRGAAPCPRLLLSPRRHTAGVLSSLICHAVQLCYVLNA